MRILLLFLVVFTIFWLVKRLFLKPSQNKAKMMGGEILVQCAHCHTHVPKSSALYINEQFYCSQDHANKG